MVNLYNGGFRGIYLNHAYNVINAPMAGSNCYTLENIRHLMSHLHCLF